MRRSCQIASEAIKDAMKKTKYSIICSTLVLSLIHFSPPRQMSSELELHAFIDYRCRALGAQHLAYPPVVAAGPNATIVHYTHSAQALDRRSLVLVDAGCELHGYTSDITRAWPGGGAKFSDPQRAIYEVSNKMMQFSTQYIFNSIVGNFGDPRGAAGDNCQPGLSQDQPGHFVLRHADHPGQEPGRGRSRQAG